jgi:ribosomal protein L3 glutamine methyltransferase
MFSCAPSYLTTVRDLLRFAISQFETAKLFYGHGTQNAFDEAAYLILSTLYLPVDRLEPFLDATLLPDEIAMVLKVIETRVMTRKPAAYLTHEAWLHDYRFYVDERVLIPRSFIAELLLQQLNPWVSFPELIQRGLDLCTGSGCLAIMMADVFPDAYIDAIDLSCDALKVAERNVTSYGLHDRINLICSDLFNGIQGNTYDLIISNPPYVDALSIAQLPAEYLHEPEMALGSGFDGLDITRQILKQAARFLNPEGLLIVEIGHNRDILEQAYPHLPFTWLPTSGGDGFVFLLTREELERQL